MYINIITYIHMYIIYICIYDICIHTIGKHTETGLLLDVLNTWTQLQGARGCT
jgi:hypothetical protein